MTTITTSNSGKVFRGSDDALVRYLRHFEPPLVALPRKLNPYYDEVEILVSLASQTPFGNGKSVAVSGMLDAAREAGDLEGVSVLIEGSSGNTAAVLPVLASQYGIKCVEAFVPGDVPSQKTDVLIMQNVDYTTHTTKPGGESASDKARELGTQPGYLNLGQYENQANPRANQRILAPLIDRQTDSEVTLISTGLGTTGTAIGLQRYFGKRATVIGVLPNPKEAIPGMRNEDRLKEVRFDWRAELPATETVGRHESFEKSLRLIQEGLMAGPSSGAAFVGLLRFIKRQKSLGTLEIFRKDKLKRIVAVVICPDGPSLYLPLYKGELSTEELARQ